MFPPASLQPARRDDEAVFVLAWLLGVRRVRKPYAHDRFFYKRRAVIRNSGCSDCSLCTSLARSRLTLRWCPSAATAKRAGSAGGSPEGRAQSLYCCPAPAARLQDPSLFVT